MSYRGRGSRGNSRGRGGFGSGFPSQPNRMKYMKVAKQAANKLNQYYLERFIKLKKDADLRNVSCMSMSYKRVIVALSKYPLPILCAQQTIQLEGVGDVTAQKFQSMIEDREKEYSDQVFNIALLKEQGKRINFEARQFAGLSIEEDEIDELAQMSLKEYLIKRDLQTYKFNNGIEDEVDRGKKRKLGEMSKEEEDGEESKGSKRLKLQGPNGKVTGSAFLDIGSVSWSILLSIYFLALHDDRKSFCITLESIKEMLDVLKNEFNDFMPFETDKQMIDQFALGDFLKLKESGFIETTLDDLPGDANLWKIIITDKGKTKAKALCKSVGLQVSLETDLENPSKNKISINMYDKDLMPVVDNLYLRDGTQIQQTKQELNIEGSVSKAQIFDGFIGQIEQEIDGYLFEMGQVTTNKNEEEKNQSVIMSELFEAANLVQDDDEEEDDDIIMDEYQAITGLKDFLIEDNNSLKFACEKEVANPSTVGTDKSIDSKSDVKYEKKKKVQQYQPLYTSEVILFVDNREKKNQQQGNYLFERLTATNVKCELKSLPLGDFIWVLRVHCLNPIRKNEEFIEDDDHDQEISGSKKRSKKQPGDKTKKSKKQNQQKDYTDYVLDFICERKTADDLAASIMDGRYEEQKFRLKNCEINNVIYLVEGKPSQHCKIPGQVLDKAQIHTQIFHGFNILRLDTISQTLKWLTDMTREIKKSVELLKQKKDFEQQIANTLNDFKHFASESGKNSNLNVQQIFSRQLRTIKGLGIDHIQTIVRVFKTPFLLYQTFKRCNQEKHSLNLLNAGKMELMRNEFIYRKQLVTEDFIDTCEVGNPSLPKKIEDTDRVNLQNVHDAAMPNLFPKILREFEKEYGVKMRKINKNQCQNIYEFFSKPQYKNSKQKYDREDFEEE